MGLEAAWRLVEGVIHKKPRKPHKCLNFHCCISKMPPNVPPVKTGDRLTAPNPPGASAVGRARGNIAIPLEHGALAGFLVNQAVSASFTAAKAPIRRATMPTSARAMMRIFASFASV